jgi:hypothetical protein
MGILFGAFTAVLALFTAKSFHPAKQGRRPMEPSDASEGP